MIRAVVIAFSGVSLCASAAHAQSTEAPAPSSTATAPSATTSQGVRMRIVYANEGALDVSTRDGRMGPGLFIAGTVLGGVAYVAGVTLSFISLGGAGAVGLVPVLGPVISDSIGLGRCSSCGGYFALNTLPTLLLWSAAIPMIVVGARHFTQRPRPEFDGGQLVRTTVTRPRWALSPTPSGVLFSTSF
ncbi:MAG: hypothetical protein JNK05_12375 [Myxococcales bacterium]|nr:hypothetical protein [Myxococcales bacterium]